MKSKNNNGRISKIKFVIIGILLLFMIIVLHFMVGNIMNINDEYIFSIIQAETNVAAIMGALAAIITIKETQKSSLEAKKITKGQFVLELHKEFSNESYGTKIFNRCWMEYNYYNEKMNTENESFVSDEDFVEKVGEKDSEDIVKYLTFFESLYLMYRNDILSIEDLNDLFGRRFFVAINNQYIKKKLIKEWEYYKNIYRLYVRWEKEREGEVFTVGKDLLQMFKEENDYVSGEFCEELFGERNK